MNFTVRDRASAQCEQAYKNRAMTAHRFFFGYLYDAVTHTSLYTHWQKMLSWARKFRAVSITWQVLTLLLAVLETGALVILSTALFLVILPILFALMLGILITAAIESGRTNRQMQKRLTEKQICVLFMPSDPSPYFSRHARALATDGFCVLIVSPYFLSSRGLDIPDRATQKPRFYCTARREGKNLYLVRRYYFFSLRKNVLSKCRTAYLY